MPFKNFFANLTNSRQQKEDAEAKKRAEEMLIDLILELKKGRTQELIPQQSMNEYCLKAAALDQHLKNTPTMFLNTTEIDVHLRFFADEMKDAVCHDYPRAAEAAMKGLIRGVLYAREDISKSESKNMSNIILDRLATLTAYKIYIVNSKQTDQICLQLVGQLQQQANSQKELAEVEAYFETTDAKKAANVIQQARILHPDYQPTDPKQIEYLQKELEMGAKSTNLAAVNVLVYQTMIAKTNLEATIDANKTAILELLQEKGIDLNKENENVQKAISALQAAQDKWLTNLIAHRNTIIQLVTGHQLPPAAILAQTKAHQLRLEAQAKKLEEERIQAEAEAEAEKQKYEAAIKAQKNVQQNRVILTN